MQELFFEQSINVLVCSLIRLVRSKILMLFFQVQLIILIVSGSIIKKKKKKFNHFILTN